MSMHGTSKWFGDERPLVPQGISGDYTPRETVASASTARAMSRVAETAESVSTERIDTGEATDEEERRFLERAAAHVAHNFG